MNLGPGTYRQLMITAAWLFGIFLVVAFVFRRVDGSQETLSVIAGVTAWVFLVAAAVILVRGWRRRGGDATTVAARYVGAHPAVERAVGSPLQVGEPEHEGGGHDGAAQLNVMVPVSGPADEGHVDLVMARFAHEWEVLSATLVVDGDRVPLAGGIGEGAADDE
ncbi:MAG: cytochrome c oxidase assembly factor Coa1 family protein [Thermoleophilia bacterium]